MGRLWGVVGWWNRGGRILRRRCREGRTSILSGGGRCGDICDSGCGRGDDRVDDRGGGRGDHCGRGRGDERGDRGDRVDDSEVVGGCAGRNLYRRGHGGHCVWVDIPRRRRNRSVFCY